MEETNSSLTCMDILRTATLVPRVHKISETECRYMLFDITTFVEDCMTAYEGSFIRIFVNRFNDNLGWRISSVNIPDEMVTKGLDVSGALSIQLDLYLKQMHTNLTDYFYEQVENVKERDPLLYEKLRMVYKEKVS